MTTEGIGPDRPIADNKTPAGQAKNRRVEIDVKVTGEGFEKRVVDTPIQENAPTATKPVKKPGRRVKVKGKGKGRGKAATVKP